MPLGDKLNRAVLNVLSFYIQIMLRSFHSSLALRQINRPVRDWLQPFKQDHMCICMHSYLVSVWQRNECKVCKTANKSGFCLSLFFSEKGTQLFLNLGSICRTSYDVFSFVQKRTGKALKCPKVSLVLQSFSSSPLP